ncbi:uncharacterized protein KY384_007261 [Bacidia gigantensis]|uniref:uncharacterized protein n=1 Tax=Bacidia gigantensis TaxID=2732470 RepID=UPI001D04EF3E|nr:uncharacterized protein KY384_007261 [Bacidia gigantensis]KAG8528343.1 hypothetical protein KY384_007261 [Bacidia gigantensis]
MPAIRLGAGDLLEYNPKHSLLICRECQYAIQKNALESHLLRHKIYRGDRQRLLSSIAQLDILEPHLVPLPAPGSPPIDAIPVLSGYCCTAAGCRHLTASSKRMKRHWSDTHGLDGSIHLSASFARSATLQTFFRGTKVRYFEVASIPSPPSDSTEDGDADADADADEDDGDDDRGGRGLQNHTAVAVTQPQPDHVPAPPAFTKSPSQAEFNLETMTYFYHFSTITSLTLPCTRDREPAKHYWKTQVTLQALQRRWLMCGLLAISAYHLAVLADDPMTKQTYLKQGLLFSSEFFAHLESNTARNSDLRVTETDEETRNTSEQLKCLLICGQCALEKSMFKREKSTCSLLATVSLIRGCDAPVSTLYCNSDMNNTQEHQMQGVVQTSNRMHNGNPFPEPSPSNHKTPILLLNLLQALPFRIAEQIGKPENGQDVFATLSAISILVECCDISFTSDDTAAAWLGLSTWLTSVSDHFNGMLERHEPAALVVLAHWAAISVKRAELGGCWFLRGAARIVVLEVGRLLSVRGEGVLGLVKHLVDIAQT